MSKTGFQEWKWNMQSLLMPRLGYGALFLLLHFIGQWELKGSVQSQEVRKQSLLLHKSYKLKSKGIWRGIIGAIFTIHCHNFRLTQTLWALTLMFSPSGDNWAANHNHSSLFAQQSLKENVFFQTCFLAASSYCPAAVCSYNSDLL